MGEAFLVVTFVLGYAIGKHMGRTVTYHVHVSCCQQEADRGE